MMLKNNLNILNDSLLTTKCMKNHCFDKKETKKLQFFFCHDVIHNHIYNFEGPPFL